ncbi:hypothetical protein BDZ97DRAFT_1915818 [Flammula alnicola]|nr:hypothetical protein BDZ97DRAFT_1915818 [Flammula alnicola]
MSNTTQESAQPQANVDVVPKPVAFIIGAGPHIGAAVAGTLHEQGYLVALGCRNPKAEVAEGYLPVTVDASKPESIKAAFETVVKKFGHPSVVIYNAASFVTHPDTKDPLTLPVESFYESAAIGLGVYAAAQEAVISFRHESALPHPKVFIVTGNALPFNPHPTPVYSSPTIQKAIQAKLVGTFAGAYEGENFRFYYATLVSTTGGLAGPDFIKGAAAYAQVYWDLIHHHTEQGNWDYRFTLDGHKYAWYD